MPDLIHVAAAAIEDAQGRILLQRRAEDTHQGGLWEFPGGKLEPGEDCARALYRELLEELGIRVQRHRPLIQVQHDYGDRRVLLDVHRVDAFEGEPRGLEGQPLAWATPDQLPEYPMPAADLPIVNALRLPSLYLITPPSVTDTEDFLRGLDAALGKGARLIQFRVHECRDIAPAELYARARERCALQGARLLANSGCDLPADLAVDGWHLTRGELAHAEGWRESSAEGWLGASCHDAQELALAAGAGADFAVLSPVWPTASHPGARPLGWGQFAELTAAASLPVYALGGMRPADLGAAWRQGAQGVAGIRGIWPQGGRRDV